MYFKIVYCLLLLCTIFFFLVCPFILSFLNLTKNVLNNYQTTIKVSFIPPSCVFILFSLLSTLKRTINRLM